MSHEQKKDLGQRLAFVVQRYGQEITGGSEALARNVAERLARDFHVTVYTTCAQDYVTWRNELKEGPERINDVDVIRFPTEKERVVSAFNIFSEELYGRPHTQDEELLWLESQGPYVPRLLTQLERDHDRFNAIFFFTYLYFPTYYGLQIVPDRSILVPTAHDEPPLRFQIYQGMFQRPRAFAFCSAPEESLVRSRFELQHIPTVVAGMGVDSPHTMDVEGFKIRHDVRRPYLLYAGRIDAGKGCAEMIHFYNHYRQHCRGAAELLLIGALSMPLRQNPGVRYLGYLPESEKMAAMAGAHVLLCPSPYESLSIALLEGFSLSTPALVNTHSAVLRDHCLRSGGGLYYESVDGFAEALDLLVNEPELRKAMGERGRQYVLTHYQWDQVLDRYRSLIRVVGGSF